MSPWTTQNIFQRTLRQKEVHHWTGNDYKDALLSSIQISVKAYKFKINFKEVLNGIPK